MSGVSKRRELLQRALSGYEGMGSGIGKVVVTLIGYTHSRPFELGLFGIEGVH